MTFNRLHLALPAAALIAFGSAAIAAPAPAPATYVMKAGASDLYEKQSSKLVLASTQNPGLREYANMMVTDHTKSTNDIVAAAKQSGVAPKPPMLEPMQKQMIAKLTAAKGPARDKLYIDQQKKAHGMALSLHQSFASSGSAPALKQVAGMVVPVVQHHIEMLDAMPAS